MVIIVVIGGRQRMRFNIYNFNNEATEVDTGDNIIKQLFVQLMSGNEVVSVEYNNGARETFDSSNNISDSYVEGSYIVDKDHLQDWINFEITDYDKQPWHVHYKNGTQIISYKRMHKFCELFKKLACKEIY
jgi:hypothetical protein